METLAVKYYCKIDQSVGDWISFMYCLNLGCFWTWLKYVLTFLVLLYHKTKSARPSKILFIAPICTYILHCCCHTLRSVTFVLSYRSVRRSCFSVEITKVWFWSVGSHYSSYTTFDYMYLWEIHFGVTCLPLKNILAAKSNCFSANGFLPLDIPSVTFAFCRKFSWLYG